MTPIVTAVTPEYLIGLRALRNSWFQNSSSGFSFHVIGYGDEVFEQQLLTEFDNVIMNPEIRASLPCAEKCPEPNPAMYSRLLIPDLFSEHEKSVYIDADAVILKPLNGLMDLDLEEYPVAGIESWAPTSKECLGLNKNTKGIMSALMIFNHEWWRRKDILNRCYQVMNEGRYHFKTVVQAVLQLVLLEDWYRLPPFSQVQGAHESTVREIGNAYVLHFAGLNPWEPYPADWGVQPAHKDRHRAIWRSYL